jgi:hypothetical protein
LRNIILPLLRDPKAPEDWRTPRRFAFFESLWFAQRLGLRRSSAAFAGHTFLPEAKLNICLNFPLCTSPTKLKLPP